MVSLLFQNSSGVDCKMTWDQRKHKYAIMTLFEAWLPVVLSTNVLKMALWPLKPLLF